MLNYRLNKEQSKTFVKFYEKDGDTLRIHYGNNTTHIVPDTEDTRKKLNTIMESQIDDEYTTDYIDSIEDDAENFKSGARTIFIAGAVFGGFVYYIGAVATVIYSALVSGASIVLRSLSIYNGCIMKDYKKNDLYLDYKKEIQDYLTYDEEDNDLNQQEPKEVLSINDVHFMSYRQMKQMTDDIEYVLDEIETDKKRDEALGLDRERSLFKQRVKELKRNKRN